MRIIDRSALGLARLLYQECFGCGHPAGSIDHLVRRGAPHFGGDSIENLIGLCGTGNTGCHGAKHGIPYVNQRGHRQTPEAVRRQIGVTLCTHHPEKLDYVLGKLGDGPGREWLRRYYSIDVKEAA